MEHEVRFRVQHLKPNDRIRTKFIKANGQTRILYGEIPHGYMGEDGNGNFTLLEIISGKYKAIKISRVLTLEVV